jgi:predicted site-specific integrase-resolvase
MRSYSTKQVTELIGIGRMTLLRWLKKGNLREPRRLRNGGMNARVWTDRDVERVRRYKMKNYRKGRGRKAKHKR